MEKFVLPKRTYIAVHAAEMYLRRILKKPVTTRSYQAARLFLSHVLCNRVLKVVGETRDEGVYRIKLSFKGAIIVYEPAEERIVTLYPDESSKECLEMRMRVPAHFSVDAQVKDYVGEEYREFVAVLFRDEFPVITAKARDSMPTSILRILAGNWLVDLDLKLERITAAVFIREPIRKRLVSS